MDSFTDAKIDTFAFEFCCLYHDILFHLFFINMFEQFYLEEAKGRVDYQGYIFPRRRGEIVSDFIHIPTEIQYLMLSVFFPASTRIMGFNLVNNVLTPNSFV